jgi:hypothetical protein
MNFSLRQKVCCRGWVVAKYCNNVLPEVLLRLYFTVKSDNGDDKEELV